MVWQEVRVSPWILKMPYTLIKRHTQHIDAFNVNSNYACMLAGIGFDAAVAHNFSLKKERGFISYFKSTLEQQKKYNHILLIL